jgi:ubiquitin-like 1-activating enzyme E1 B
MAGNIIPAIATTNAMTAGLCVLQAFKVMRQQLDKAKMVFLTRGTERVISSEGLRPPNPQCATCGVAYATLVVDTKRAKLSDLVEDVLKGQLGYGEDFSVKHDANILYDVDEDIHLEKTFEELSLKADTFITVFDEADEDAKVDVVFSVIEREAGEDAKPINLTEELKIATKPKLVAAAPETNGHATTNGTVPAVKGLANGTTNGATKRKADDAGIEDEIVKKKGKVMEEPPQNGDDVVILDDTNDGAIIINDD